MSISQEVLLEKLKEMLSSLSEEYIDDLLLPNYVPHIWTDLSNKEKILDDTIKKYYENHEKLNINRLERIYEYLLKLIPYDKVNTFDNKVIYLEIYKILGLIDTTFEAEKILNNSKKYPSGFAQHQMGKKSINTARRFYRNNLIGKFKVTQKGESRLRYMIFTTYNKNNKLVNFFLHNFLVSDLFKFKTLHEETLENEIFIRNLEFFLTQKTTIGALIKSLGILLYTEFIYYLNINKHDAEVYSKSIIYELFKESLNLDEINKHIYIKSSLGFLPIFGTSKKANLNDKDDEFIKNRLYTELQDIYSVEEQIFEIAYNSYIKNPHIQYLRKYPVELFKENPKYSS